MAIPGSELITFSSETDAYLAGCRKLGIVEVHHYGTYDEAVILIRNQAFKMDASVIAPLDAYQDKSPLIAEDSRLNFIQGRILRCPKTDFSSNNAVSKTQKGDMIMSNVISLTKRRQILPADCNSDNLSDVC